MDDCLRNKVEALRERIKVAGGAGDYKALYQELSDLLFQAGKISAAMNILEKALATAPPGSSASEGRAFK
jgi:hypothetical protein